MKALVFHGDNDLRYESIAEPYIGKKETLVKIKAVGICGSDVHGYLGKTGRRIPPMVMGHEFAGVVEKVGPDVTNVKPGDNVVVFPYATCDCCYFCTTGVMNACANKKFFGVFTTNGAMAEYVSAKSDLLFPLPAGTEYKHGALAEPLSVSARCVNKAGIVPGQTTVTIIGAGTIGLLCLILARLQGARTIVAIDLADERLKMAKELGADFTVNAQGRGLEEYLSAHPGNSGTDVVIEAVGIESTLRQAVRLARQGGKVVVVGMSQRNIQLDMHEFISKEVKLEGTFLYDKVQFEYILNNLAFLREKLDKIISLTAPLSAGVEMYRRLAQGDPNLIKVILTD